MTPLDRAVVLKMLIVSHPNGIWKQAVKPIVTNELAVSCLLFWWSTSARRTTHG